MDNNDLSLDFLKVVEQAAIACAHTMGQGDRHGSDRVAVEAMRRVMDDPVSRRGTASGAGGTFSASESPASMDFPEERGSKILAGDSSAPAQARQVLCGECGLCCDGTLFSHAVIAADEDVDRLREIGIVTISDDEERFTLPCPAFDQVCTIYRSGRARVCGSFRCVLLRRYDAGEIPLEAAREIVREARAHRERVDAELSAACGEPGGGLVQRFEAL